MEEMDIVRFSESDLAAMGMNNLAYIKPVLVNEVKAFENYTAEGSTVTTVRTYELAAVVIRQHDLEPDSVH